MHNPRMNEHHAPERTAATTVVVVDDHDAFRASAGRLLRAEGYDVIGEAADGESAVAVISELRPDLVLLDVQLPDIDGFAVTVRLLQNSGDGYRPQIVLTSSRDRNDFGPLIEECGCNGFVAKDDLSGEALAELLP